MVSHVIVNVCLPEMQMGLVFPVFLKEITKPFADLGNRLRFSSGPFAKALGISIHFTIFQKAAFRHLGTAVFGVTTSCSPSAYGLTWETLSKYKPFPVIVCNKKQTPRSVEIVRKSTKNRSPPRKHFFNRLPEKHCLTAFNH